MPAGEQVNYVLQAMPDRDVDTLSKLAPTILERVHNQTEIREANEAGEYDWAFNDISYETTILKWKNDNDISDALPRLQQAAALMAEADFDTPDLIKSAIWDYAEEVGRGELLWPLRVALSGHERSPDPFTCAYVLGKTQTLVRINNACDKLT